METLRKPLAVILGLTAFAVLFHFVLSPFYEDVVESDDVWNVLNWFMALAVIVALIATCIAKRNADADSCDTNTYICVNVAFYVTAAVAILFFWNWFDDMTAGEDGQGQTHRFFWVVINVLFVIITGSLSAHLWKGASRE